MAYDQTTPYMGAQYISQGIAQAGQGLTEGLQQYAKNKQADAIATGQIEAYLKQAAAGGTPLSDGTQKLADKFTAGKAALNDKMSLLGSLQTDSALKTLSQQQQLSAQQIASGAQQQQIGAQQLQQQTIATQNAQRQQAALQRLSQMGQLAQGVGGGVLSPQVQAGQQAALQDPTTNMMARYANATGTLPPAALLSQYVQRQQAAEQPAGFVYGGTVNNPDTAQPQFDKYTPILKRNDGNVRYGDTVQVPAGAPAPGTLLDSSTFKPIGPSSTIKSGINVSPSMLAPGQPQPITGPQAKAAEQANADYQKAQNNFNDSVKLANAVQAYSTAYPHGDMDNAAMGTKAGLAMRAAMDNKSGQTGYALKQAISGMEATQYGDFSTGSGRLSSTTFDKVMGNLPDTTYGPSTNTTATQGILKLRKYQMDFSKAVKDAINTPGTTLSQAQNIAMNTVHYPFDQPTPGTVTNTVPNLPNAAPATPAPAAAPAPTTAMPVVRTADDYAKVVASGHGIPYRTPSGNIRYTP